MRKLIVLCMFALFLLSGARAQQSDNSNIRKVPLPIPQDQMIQKVAAKETEFAGARNQYLFKQEVTVNEIGIGSMINGQYYTLSEVIFDDTGKRVEHYLKTPPSTLPTLTISPQDLVGFGVVTPFALTTSQVQNFQIDYVGKEKIDELDTYVFDITPKFMLPLLDKIKRGKKVSAGDAGGEEGRSFMGRIWIDDRDLQIVKTAGKAVPEAKQRFPHFESYRENIDGKYWFPTYVYGDDELDFGRGPAIHMRFEVKYSNYRKFSGAIELVDEDAPKKPIKPGEKPDKP